MISSRSSLMRAAMVIAWGAASLVMTVNAQTTDSTCAAYTGGWALRSTASSCPPTAPVSCNVGLQPRCCPSGTVCRGEGDYTDNYCCAPGEDCTALSSSQPKCPDPTWSLWGVNSELDSGGWCCTPGNVGYYTNTGTPMLGCVDSANTTLAKGLSFASTVSAATPCSTSSSSSSSSSSTSSATTTSSSTTGSEQQTSGASSEAADSGSSSSLSSGAIAGIAIGCAAMGILTAVFAALLLLKKRRARKSAELESARDSTGYGHGPTPKGGLPDPTAVSYVPTSGSYYPASEPPSYPAGGVHRPPPPVVSELSGSSQVGEMQGDTVVMTPELVDTSPRVARS